jgi:hypothetical protein
LATVDAATAPPAPVRFSITTGCPQPSLSLAVIKRATSSFWLPGPVVTNRTGLFGKFFGCACAGLASTAMATPIAITVDQLTRCKSGIAISCASRSVGIIPAFNRA